MTHCDTCTAPSKWPAYFIRCGTCAVINGKLPPTNYIPIAKALP